MVSSNRWTSVEISMAKWHSRSKFAWHARFLERHSILCCFFVLLFACNCRTFVISFDNQKYIVFDTNLSIICAKSRHSPENCSKRPALIWTFAFGTIDSLKSPQFTTDPATAKSFVKSFFTFFWHSSVTVFGTISEVFVLLAFVFELVVSLVSHSNLFRILGSLPNRTW